jgi:FkbM family methyltransferase
MSKGLRRSFAAEIEKGQVIIYPKGVWHREEELKFFVYGNSALDSFVMPERIEEHSKPREVRMPVTAIDLIVTELKLDRVDFIKMDIEGAERHAMNGAQTTLAKFHPRMSIALENLPDDQYVVPPLVHKAWTGYRQEFGRCTLARNGLIQPDVMFFY